jgi:hypothetical protein
VGQARGPAISNSELNDGDEVGLGSPLSPARPLSRAHKRGLTGVQFVVSEAHEGSAVPGSARRREQRPTLAALIRPIFKAESGEQERELVGDQNARPHEHRGTAGLARFAGLGCLLKR